MTRNKVALITLAVLGLLFVMPYLSLGDPPPLTPEGRFARMTGFSLPRELGGETFMEAHVEGPRFVKATYTGGASLSAGHGGDLIHSWNPDTVSASTNPCNYRGPHRCSAIDLRGVRALATEFLPIGKGGVRLTWVDDDTMIVLELLEVGLADAVVVAESF